LTKTGVIKLGNVPVYLQPNWEDTFERLPFRLRTYTCAWTSSDRF